VSAGSSSAAIEARDRRRRDGPARGSRMALCVWWRDFELRIERARAPELADRPLALSDESGGTRRMVEQACPLAEAHGVRPGQRISQAIALCPSLVLLEQDPDVYDAARERVRAVLRGWSPVVEPTGERGRVFVGVDGLERLYGPPEGQIDDLEVRLGDRFPAAALEHVRFGYAPGKFGSWVAARAAPPGGRIIVPAGRLPVFLAGQPVDVLPVSPRMIQRLRRLGVDRLDRFVELPEPALIAQFGADGRRALEWATGRRVDRVYPERRERPVRVSLDFPAPVGQIELLHGALDRLIARALRRTKGSGRSVCGIRVGARLEDGGSWSIRAILKDPTGRPDRLGAFLRSRIALSPPPRAVLELSLEFFRFGPSAAQTDLFDPRHDAPRVTGSLETRDGELLPPLREASRQLRLRLGEGVLYRVLELEPHSRIPERRHALLEIA